MVRSSSSLALPFLGLLSASMLWANQIDPGQMGVTPDVFSSLGSTATVIAESSMLDFSFDNGLTYGTYQEYVATDTANPYCSGCLDFGFIFNVTDPNNFIDAISLASFAGFEADGGFFSDVSGLIDPSGMDRTFSGPGAGIAFTFDDGVLPGESSSILVIETNATSYNDLGGAEFFDDNSVHTFVLGYEPVATPEPSTFGFTLAGLVALVLVARRSRRSSHSPRP